MRIPNIPGIPDAIRRAFEMVHISFTDCADDIKYHKSRHATGGADALTPADISAASSADLTTHKGSGDHDGRYYTETELNAGQLNNIYYTETESDNKYYFKTGGTVSGIITVGASTPTVFFDNSDASYLDQDYGIYNYQGMLRVQHRHGAGVYVSEPLAISDSAVFVNNNVVLHTGNCPLGYIQLEHQETSGTVSGTFTSGADRVRKLNVKVLDSLSRCTLSNNQFTLTAGRYRFKIKAPVYRVDKHQAFLYNITTSAESKRGLSGTASNADYAFNSSDIMWEETISVPTTYEVRHRCETTVNNEGFGRAAGYGTEVYLQVSIEVLA